MTKQMLDDQGPRISEIHREVKARLQTAADADAEMSRKAKVAEKKIDVLELAVPKERELLERMKKDCHELQTQIKARDSKAAAEKEAELQEAVKTGTMGVVQFHEQISQHRRAVKLQAETIDVEISEAVAAVRAKALEVLKMENQLAEARVNFYFLSGYPTETALGEIGKYLKEMSHRSQTIAGHLYNARVLQAKTKELLDLGKGASLRSGWQGGGTLADVQALAFDPSIPEKYLTPLAQIIVEIEAHEQKLLAANTTPGGNQRYLGQEGRYYLSCSFMAGLTRPWSWMEQRNPIAMSQVSKADDTQLTLSNLPGQSKIAEA